MRVTVESTSEEDEEEDEEVVVEVEQRAASLSLQDSLTASSRCMLVGDVGFFSGLKLLYGLANI